MPFITSQHCTHICLDTALPTPGMLLLLSMHSVHDHCMLVARPDMMHTHMGHVGFVANTSRHSLYATLVTSDDRTDTEKMSMALALRQHA